MAEHTKTPWVGYGMATDRPTIHGACLDSPTLGAEVCVVSHRSGAARANADAILRAVNSHDALLAACKKALADLLRLRKAADPDPGWETRCATAMSQCWPRISEIEAAIAGAEKE